MTTEWESVIQSMIDSCQKQIQFYKTDETREQYHRYSHQYSQLVEIILPLEKVGRLNNSIEDEIISVFTRNKYHRQDTITRRLFKLQKYDEPNYYQDRFVRRLLERMQEKKLLNYHYGKNMWCVLTPELKAQIVERKRIRKEKERRRQLEEEKQMNMIQALRNMDIQSAKAAMYSTNSIIISVDDMDNLYRMLHTYKNLLVGESESA